MQKYNAAPQTCAITVSFLRKSCTPRWLMSVPSISMVPDTGSMMRNSASDIDDLPAPVRPTMPICGHNNHRRRYANDSPYAVPWLTEGTSYFTKITFIQITATTSKKVHIKSLHTLCIFDFFNSNNWALIHYNNTQPSEPKQHWLQWW